MYRVGKSPYTVVEFVGDKRYSVARNAVARAFIQRVKETGVMGNNWLKRAFCLVCNEVTLHRWMMTGDQKVRYCYKCGVRTVVKKKGDIV